MSYDVRFRRGTGTDLGRGMVWPRYEDDPAALEPPGSDVEWDRAELERRRDRQALAEVEAERQEKAA